MAIANPRIAALYHQLHALVLADMHWGYAGRSSLTVVPAVEEGGLITVSAQWLDLISSRAQQPRITIAAGEDERFRLGLICSCGFTRKLAKPGALCQHTWTLARELSHRLEHRHWKDLGPIRDLLGIGADEEALALLETLEIDLATAERLDHVEAPKTPDRRLVWIIDLESHIHLRPGTQSPIRTGWSKPKHVRELSPLLVLPSTEADRHLLSAIAAGRVEPILRRYATWAPLLSQGNLVDPEGHELSGNLASLTLRMADEPGGGYRLISPELEAKSGWKQLIGEDVVVLQGSEGLLALAATRGQTAALARLRRQPLVIPESLVGAPRLHAVVARLGVAPPGEIASKEEPANCQSGVFIERVGPTLEIEFQANPLVGGPWFPIGQGQPLVSAKGPDGAWRHVRRMPAEEHAQGRALAGRLGLPVDDRADYRWLVSGARALDVVAALTEHGITAQWKGTPMSVHDATVSDLAVKISKKRDWLQLEGGVAIDGQVVALAQILEALRQKRGFVAVGHDKLLRLHGDLKRRLELLGAAADDGAQAPALAAPLVLEALDGLTNHSGDAAWSALQERLAAAEGVDTALPPGLHAELRHYQRDGYAWMCRLAHWGAGAVLADDMGLGKTVQTIAMLARRGPLGPQLVVCPTSVEPNWEDELKRFAPSLSVRRFRDERDLIAPMMNEVVLVSYQLAHRGVERLGAITWASLILDEAQMAKNAAAKRTAALATLPADWRLALTGTPVENRLGELWSIMHLVVPGLLGSGERFRTRFAKPIEADHDPQAAEALRQRIRPFVLRRTKEQVLTELPAKTEIVRHVEPSPDERRLVEAERARALADLESGKGKDGKGGQRIAILAALTRLRQLACAPQLVVADSQIPSTKIAALTELVHELRAQGHRLLVFSQFTSFLDLVETAWAGAGLAWLRLDGSTPANARRDLVARFQGGEGDAFLLSLKAGGTGLNLTAASYVIHLDPWWNPASEDQASDRAHRMGQTKPVTIIRLVSTGSVEERILALHAEKRDLIDAVLAGSDAAATLSEADLLGLLRGGVAPSGEAPTASEG